MFDAIKNLGSEIPDKKKWIDVITATLTIPVLLTVIIANVNNIKHKDVKGVETASPTQAPLIVREIITQLPTATTIPTPTQSISVTPSCKLASAL